ALTHGRAVRGLSALDTIACADAVGRRGVAISDALGLAVLRALHLLAADAGARAANADVAFECLAVAQAGPTKFDGVEVVALVVAPLQDIPFAAQLVVTANVLGAGSGGGAAGFAQRRAVGFDSTRTVVVARLQDVAVAVERVGQADGTARALSQRAVLDGRALLALDLQERGGAGLALGAFTERFVGLASDAFRRDLLARA